MYIHTYTVRSVRSESTDCSSYECYMYVYMYPGGKVRAISRRVLARGDIARDPARLRQIPWFRVRLRKGAKRRDYARSRVHIINARVSHPGSKAPRQVLNTKHPTYITTFFVFSNSSRRAMLLHQGAPGARQSIARRRGSPRTLAS